MDSSEEPTEMTAMTSAETSPDSGTGMSLTMPDGAVTITDHRKAWFKRLFNSPRGKCILIGVFITLIAFASYIMSKLIMGSLYMGSCPLDPFIPIYLVVSASLLIAFAILLIVVLVKCQQDEDDDRVHPAHLIVFVYFFIHLVLQLAGSVCVIRTRNEVEDAEPQAAANQPPPTSCDSALLSYAFGVVIFELILSGLFLVFAIISLCEVTYLVCCRVPNHSKHPATR